MHDRGETPASRRCLPDHEGFVALPIVSYIDTMPMGSKHRKTLQAIFADPVRSNVRWSEIEKLLQALGAQLSEGRGSRVRIALAGARAVFHRPHPGPDTDKGALRSVRRFLTQAGIAPEE